MTTAEKVVETLTNFHITMTPCNNQETEAMYKQASKDLKRGDFKAALEVYLKILTMLHHILSPPFRDYLLCQQSIRKCMLTFGNKYIKQVQSGN